MVPISGEAVIFALGVVGFAMCLLTLIAVLTFLRQRRAWKEHQADTHIRPPKSLSGAIKEAGIIPPAPKVPVKPKPRPIPEPQRLPVHDATADQVVIQIEPAEGPTRDQRNIQRLIDFLKDESQRNAKVNEDTRPSPV